MADELYAARPEEFVARRNELATEAKGEDNALAAEIKKLAKPTTAAWVVNMLVRHEADQVEQILSLGAALREAQESMAGEDLRQLGRQRRQLTAAVTRQARALAAELGQKVGEQVATQVEETLHAAMVDEDAAKAVRLGLLVKPLAVTGTHVEDVIESVAVPGALGEAAVRRARPVESREPATSTDAKKPELTVVADDSAAIEEAETALKEAEAGLAAAERKLDKARRRVEKREAKGLQLQSELDELRRRIAELEQRVEANEDELTAAEEARDECEDSVEEARSGVERARKVLQKLR
jgi:chromosome segregation ATPase